MHDTMRRRALVGLLLATLTAACEAGDADPAEAGRRVYVANCTACHNPDPTREGTLGPAVAGSSRALLEARVLGGKYPPGYTPKRDSGLMQPLPYLKNDMEALAAYLTPPP